MAGKSKYTFKNEKYFSKIDNEKNAYFLGLIFADGSMNDKLKTLSINLVETDKEILELFIREIYKDRELRKVNPRKKEYKIQYQATVTSRIIYEDLKLYNLCQNKSEIGQWVNENWIPEDLFHHFIRGYFDGDGCIYHNKTSGDKVVTFTGNHVFIESLRRFLVSKLGLRKGNISKRYEKGFSSTLAFGGVKQVERLRDYLYKDATVYLKRKKLKFNEL